MHFGSRKFPRKQTHKSENEIHFFFSLSGRLTVALCPLSIFSLNRVFLPFHIYTRDKCTRKQPLIANRCVMLWMRTSIYKWRLIDFHFISIRLFSMALTFELNPFYWVDYYIEFNNFQCFHHSCIIDEEYTRSLS